MASGAGACQRPGLRLLPCPEGLEYLPYQRVAISFALAREHTLIADEMGLGKTVEALGVVTVVSSLWRSSGH